MVVVGMNSKGGGRTGSKEAAAAALVEGPLTGFF